MPHVSIIKDVINICSGLPWRTASTHAIHNEHLELHAFNIEMGIRNGEWKGKRGEDCMHGRSTRFSNQRPSG